MEIFFFSFHVIDLRHQVDQLTPKEIQLFEENRNDTGNARIFFTLIRQKQIEMISDGNKTTEFKVIKKL